MTLSGKHFLCQLTLVIALFAPKPLCAETAPGAPCGPQDYDGASAPDFTCPGPEEAALSADLRPPRSLAVRYGYKLLNEEGQELAVMTWEGAVVHRDKLVEMGLKLRAIRRLRWADRLHLRRNYDIRLQHQEELAESRLQMVRNQRDAYEERARQAREQAQRSRAWWRSPALWFCIGMIVTGALVALTGWALASAS